VIDDLQVRNGHERDDRHRLALAADEDRDDLLPVAVQRPADESPLAVDDDAAVGLDGHGAWAQCAAHSDIRSREHLVLDLVREHARHPPGNPVDRRDPRGGTVAAAELTGHVNQSSRVGLVTAIARGYPHAEDARVSQGLYRLLVNTPILFRPG